MKKTKVVFCEAKDIDGRKFYLVQYRERTWLAWLMQDWHIVKASTDRKTVEDVFNELTQ